MKPTLPPPEPEWFKLLAEDALVNSLEFAALLGIGHRSVTSELPYGCLPKPDKKSKGMTRGFAPRCYWKKETVRAELERRRNCHK